MLVIPIENLTIIFGDRDLSCDPKIPQTDGGMLAVIGQEPFKTISKTLKTDRVVLPHQTHGIESIVIRSESDADTHMANFADSDIVITNAPQIAVGVLTADCLPLILFDAQNRILAAVHAGWRGTIKNVAQAAIEQMVELGAKPAGITAYFGPCAHVDTYQASPELIQALESSKYRQQVLQKNSGKIYFDLPGMNKLQLMDAGLLPENCNLDYCLDTLTNTTLWSYRRDGEQALRQPTCALFN